MRNKDFPGGLMVKNSRVCVCVCVCVREVVVQVQSLVRELRIHVASGQKTKTQNINKVVTNSQKTF